MVNIFDVPVKTTVNRSMKGKSIMVVGLSKAGKSTLAAQAPKPIFLCTENGTEALTGITPIPIASWSDFKAAVTQLCSEQARNQFDTVVIDTYTNLIMLLDKYVGSKLSTDKKAMDFGSEADYGKGTKAMRNELGIQLQKLANQGYVLLNIVHAEEKTDFNTQKDYIGTSLSNSLYGVAEKFVDQIIYLRRDVSKNGNVEHKIWFNEKGGFKGAGGRFTPAMDSAECSYAALENALISAIEASGVETVDAAAPAFKIEVEELDFDELLAEFKDLTERIMKLDTANASAITKIVEKELGVGKKVNNMTANQAELLKVINENLKNDFRLS